MSKLVLFAAACGLCATTLAATPSSTDQDHAAHHPDPVASAATPVQAKASGGSKDSASRSAAPDSAAMDK